MQESRRNYRADIDGLRALAVLSVIFFHLNFSFFNGGFVGVDVFFVISGFLITRIIYIEIESSDKFQFKRFYIKRVRRLAPALLFTLILSFVFSVLLLSPLHLEMFGKSLMATAGNISNILFWTEAEYFDIEANVKPLLHTWSLGVEEQYYLVWPIVLVFILLRVSKSNIMLLLISLIAIVLSLIVSDLFKDGSEGQSTIFYLFPFRVFEFSIGGILVAFSANKNNKLIAEGEFIVGLLLVAYSVFFFTEDILFPHYNALIPCIGAALIIHSGGVSFFSKLLNNRLMVGIGLSSYSVYLIHWLIIVFWGYWTFEPFSFLEKINIVFLSLGAGYLMFRFVEQPFRKEQLVVSSGRFITFIIISFLVIGGIGFLLSSSQGWKWRLHYNNLPQDIWAQAKNSKEFRRDNYGGAGYPYTGAFEGSESPFDIVLLGDSHGRHYAKGLSTFFAEKIKSSIYGASGDSCMHLPDFGKVGSNVLCLNQLNQGIKALSSSPNAIVIISHSWLKQLSRGQLVSDDNIIKKNLSVADLLASIYKLKKRLKHHHLVVIGGVPGSGVNRGVIHKILRPSYLIPDSQLKNNLLGRKRQGGIGEEFNQKLKVEAQHTGLFTFLDPYDALCTETQCTNITPDGRLVYSDSSHLSGAGSELVIGYFEKQLIKIIQSSKSL